MADLTVRGFGYVLHLPVEVFDRRERRVDMLAQATRAWDHFRDPLRTWATLSDMLDELYGVNGLVEEYYQVQQKPGTYEWIVLRHQVRRLDEQLRRSVGQKTVAGQALNIEGPTAPRYLQMRNGRIMLIESPDPFDPRQLPHENDALQSGL